MPVRHFSSAHFLWAAFRSAWPRCLHSHDDHEGDGFDEQARQSRPAHRAGLLPRLDQPRPRRGHELYHQQHRLRRTSRPPGGRCRLPGLHGPVRANPHRVDADRRLRRRHDRADHVRHRNRARLSAPGAECLTVSDGKITHSRFIFDRTPFDAARQAATWEAERAAFTHRPPAARTPRTRWPRRCPDSGRRDGTRTSRCCPSRARRRRRSAGSGSRSGRSGSPAR